MNKYLSPSICKVVLLLAPVAGCGATLPKNDDPRAAELAREVHGKGWIAYSAWTEQGTWDLFFSRPDGTQQRNITNTPDFHEMGVRFSPDGRRILYRRIAKELRVPNDKFGAMGILVIANADGSNPIEYGKPGEFPWASWSPDGKQVACLTVGGIEIWDLESKKMVRKLDRKGIYQQLYWSPDGNWLTGPANHYGEKWTVIRLNAATGEANPVAKYQNCTPDWFPDSKRLIFSSRPKDQEVLDGGKLAASIGQKPDYGWTQLWMANGDGSDRRLVYGEDGRHIYSGVTSPDGKYVMFNRSEIDGVGKDRHGAPMALMRLRDAPIIAGESAGLRKQHPEAKNGPLLNLQMGWEPHWTYTAVGGKK
jgi:Tol biopolymer transport system component